MYFFAHLLAGIFLGILLAYFFRDSLLVPACAIGSILPDLIDKPVGILIFYDTIGYGRIYCHTLLFAGLVLFAGILVYLKYPRSGLLLLAMAAGIFTHQVLDAMWLQPSNWYWPVLGPFKGHSRPDFFVDAFWRTIRNPTEWLAGIAILAFLIIATIPRYREQFRSELNRPWLRQISLTPLLLLAVIAILILSILIQYGL